MDSRQTMYESGVLSQATAGPLRPGGASLTERLLELCTPSVGASILDVGCGEGGTVASLRQSGYQAFGIDRSHLLAKTGIRQHAHLPLVCGSGAVLPIASHSTEVIIAECSLSAMADIHQALAEFQRVLCRTGKLALSDIYVRNPEGQNQLHALQLRCGLRYAITKEDLARRLAINGFEITAWEDHSESLKHLAAQLTLSHGSLCEFWNKSEPDADPFDIILALSKAKLGYYLLIAQKH